MAGWIGFAISDIFHCLKFCTQLNLQISCSSFHPENPDSTAREGNLFHSGIIARSANLSYSMHTVKLIF
jgi:hypothetical protein